MRKDEIIFLPGGDRDSDPPVIDPFIISFDDQNDPFKSDVHIDNEGVRISKTGGRKFGLSLRWNVAGYGYLYMPIDNGGEYYSLDSGKKVYHISFELLKTRVGRNIRRLEEFKQEGFSPSKELSALLALGEEHLNDAQNSEPGSDKGHSYSQTGLKYALLSSELLEIERSRFHINKNGTRSGFLFGCDTRGYFQMDKDLFLNKFTEVFNYGTITHYLTGDVINFEEQEGLKRFSERDRLLDKLLERGITVEGRPLFWTHTWVTPSWLKEKSYSDLLKYVESHVQEVIKHYGDRVLIWEIVNEMHDWANEVQLNHDQTIELTKLACEAARDANPKVKLLINNCCPFADYVQLGKWHERKAKYPQRTPHQFTKQLVEAGVDFDIIGVQVYFVKRTLTEALQAVERYKIFGKRVQLAEVGSPSRGITQEFTEDYMKDYSHLPFEWRRHWDEKLQGDWLEFVFTYAYGQTFIEAANWYDFADPQTFLKSGGILKSNRGEEKEAFKRLKHLQKKWNSI